MFVDVADSLAIGNHVSFKVPLLAENLFQQGWAGATWLTIETVVGPHHRGCFPLLHAGFKGWQVGFAQVAFIHPRVEMMPVGLRPAVGSEMLGRGHQLQVLGMFTLEALDKRHAHRGCKARVFPIGLLPAPPAGVAKYVDVGRPEG